MDWFGLPELARNATSGLPILGALLLVMAVNTKRQLRARQYLLPVVASIYAVGAVIVLHRFNAWLDSLIERIVQAVPLLRDWYQADWLYVLENTLVVVGFLVIKVILKPIFARLFSGSTFTGDALLARVYEFDAQHGIWFVERRFGGMRAFYRALYVSSLVLVILIVALAATYSLWPGFLSVSFPAVAALVIGEFFFAINGLTKEEFRRDVLGEADDAHRVANYSRLRQVLADTFPGNVVFDGVSLAAADATRSGAVLDDLSRSQNDIDRLAASYYQRVKATQRDLDANLLGAAVDVLHGQSVLVLNPFYEDLTEYVALPTYVHLLQRGKCLVIAGRDSLTGDLVEWMKRGLEGITGVPDLWTVQVLHAGGSDDVDVGVLRFADIHNVAVLLANESFLSEVSLVVVAEPSQLLTTGQLGAGVFLNRCRAGGSPVFLAFDRNHDGLVDSLSHLFKVSLTEVVASALPRGASSHIVWRTDGPSMSEHLLPGVSRYLGGGTEIGAVALKYDVSTVSWLGGSRFPVIDMGWIAGQYYGPICAVAGVDVSQASLEERMRRSANPWGMPQSANAFLVVEDEFANAFESIRLYSTRATGSGFVNLMSEDYLLRDYMVANSGVFSTDPKAIPSIAADFARTERNTALRLLVEAGAFGVPESVIAHELELAGVTTPPPGDLAQVGVSGSPIAEMLAGLLRDHAGVENVSVSRRNPPTSVYASPGKRDPLLEIDHADAWTETLRALSPAYFYVESEDPGEYIGALLYGHVFQAMLPGQFLTHEGKYYEVVRIGGLLGDEGVVLRRAAEHVRGRHAYRQLRDYDLSDLRPSPTMGSRITVDGMRLTRWLATVGVRTRGFIDAPSRRELAQGHRVLIEDLPVRTYRSKAVLEFQVPGASAEVRRTLATLLNEAFVTLFPQAHPYVVAVTSDPDGVMGDLLHGFSADSPADDSIFIIEDSVVDLGLLVTIERNWRRILDTLADYLRWYATPAPQPADEAQQGVPAIPEFAPPASARRRSWIVRVARRLWGWCTAIARWLTKPFRRRTAREEPSESPGNGEGTDGEGANGPTAGPEAPQVGVEESRDDALAEGTADAAPEETADASPDGAAEVMTNESGAADGEK
jgi:hypothetical protein